MIDFGKAIGNAIVDGITAIISELINFVLRKLGYSDIETKRIKIYISWTIFAAFIVFIFWLTFRYS
jgi:hypothetical protein